MRTLVCAVLLAVAAAPARGEGRPQLRIGDAAPDFELPALKRGKVSGASLRGAPAVLFFAATWCPYSNRLSQAVEGLHQRYRERGVRVLLVDVKEGAKAAKKHWVKKKDLSVPVLLDEKGEVARAYAPPASFLPKADRANLMVASVLLVDAEGRIRHFPAPTTNPGEIDWELKGLEAALGRLLSARR